MPSLTHGEALGEPKRRVWLVSLSVKSSGTSASQYRKYVANGSPCAASACSARATGVPGSATRAIRGFAPPPRHDHVLRNHSVGSTCSGAASGPRLHTLIRTRMSSGDAFAYSTNTSK